MNRTKALRRVARRLHKRMPRLEAAYDAARGEADRLSRAMARAREEAYGQGGYVTGPTTETPPAIAAAKEAYYQAHRDEQEAARLVRRAEDIAQACRVAFRYRLGKARGEWE